MNDIRADVERFYSLLSRLTESPLQGLRLDEYTGHSRIPARGVYFFCDSAQPRSLDANSLRVVRVGTHAVSDGSKTTLWTRLRTHLGTRKGGGDHRRSIFRLHVGKAMLNRDHVELPTWGVGSSPPPRVKENPTVRAAEADHEKKVSAYIAAMLVLWIDEPDEPCANSARAYIERNSIALLSNHLTPVDQASADWLGRQSPEEEIRRSALWNLKHVQETYDREFLNKLETAVERTCANHRQ